MAGPELRRVEAAVAGDPEAFGELVAAHWTELVRLARVVLASELDAEDVAQETLVHAWPRLGGLRDSSRFLPWLRRSLVRRAIRHLKRSRATAQLVGELAAESPDAPDTRIDLRRLLSRLPPRERAVFYLTEVEGCSDEETAAGLGLARATVRVHRYLARRRLRRALGGETP